jgi:hypothetical protein
MKRKRHQREASVLIFYSNPRRAAPGAKRTKGVFKNLGKYLFLFFWPMAAALPLPHKKRTGGC